MEAPYNEETRQLARDNYDARSQSFSKTIRMYEHDWVRFDQLCETHHLTRAQMFEQLIDSFIQNNK